MVNQYIKDWYERKCFMFVGNGYITYWYQSDSCSGKVVWADLHIKYFVIFREAKAVGVGAL
jgi:hypothetical protein